MEFTNKNQELTLEEYLDIINDEETDLQKKFEFGCLFMQKCIKDNNKEACKQFMDKFGHLHMAAKLESTSFLAQNNAEINFPLEIIAEDFKSLFEKCEKWAYYNDNISETQPKNENKLRLFIDNILLSFELDTIGIILGILLLIFNIVIGIIQPWILFITIPTTIRLLTKTDSITNKISCWIATILCSLILFYLINDINAYIIIIPIVAIVLSFIKGFSVNKYCFIYTILLNIIIYQSSPELLKITIPISILLIIQIIFKNKWENDWVLDWRGAAGMARNFFEAQMIKIQERKDYLQDMLIDMLNKNNLDDLVYIPEIKQKETKERFLPKINTIYLWVLIIELLAFVYCFAFNDNNIISKINNKMQAKQEYKIDKSKENYTEISEEKYPFTATRELTKSELKSYSKSELKIMRNEIYARHGYIFKTDAMKSYFAQQSWYEPKYNNVDKYLNSIEIKNIATIKKVEDSK